MSEIPETIKEKVALPEGDERNASESTGIEEAKPEKKKKKKSKEKVDEKNQSEPKEETKVDENKNQEKKTDPEKKQTKKKKKKAADDGSSTAKSGKKKKKKSKFLNEMPEKKTIRERGHEYIELQRAKRRLRIKKKKAAKTKHIPLVTRVLGEPNKILTPYDLYFVSRIEPALNDIFWAAMKGNVQRVIELVDIEGGDVNDTHDPWGYNQTPLHWAAKGGSTEVVKYLLERGADVRAIDDTGSYPLHFSCWAGHVDSTIALLKATDVQDLYVRDYDATLGPIEWAEVRGHEVLIKAISNHLDSIWLPEFGGRLIDDILRGRYGQFLNGVPLPKRNKSIPKESQPTQEEEKPNVEEPPEGSPEIIVPETSTE